LTPDSGSGSARTSTLFGHLKPAMRARQCAMICSLVSTAPATGTTTAWTASPH